MVKTRLHNSSVLSLIRIKSWFWGLDSFSTILKNLSRVVMALSQLNSLISRQEATQNLYSIYKVRDHSNLGIGKSRITSWSIKWKWMTNSIPPKIFIWKRSRSKTVILIIWENVRNPKIKWIKIQQKIP